MIPLYNREYYRRQNRYTIIGFLKYLMFPHSLYPYLTTNPFAPLATSRSSLHLYPSRIVSTLFSLMTYNVYKDISNNIPYYSIRKSNIIIIYQLRNILYNILYKKEFILIRNLGHFLTQSETPHEDEGWGVGWRRELMWMQVPRRPKSNHATYLSRRKWAMDPKALIISRIYEL